MATPPGAIWRERCRSLRGQPDALEEGLEFRPRVGEQVVLDERDGRRRPLRAAERLSRAARCSGRQRQAVGRGQAERGARLDVDDDSERALPVGGSDRRRHRRERALVACAARGAQRAGFCECPVPRTGVDQQEERLESSPVPHSVDACAVDGRLASIPSLRISRAACAGETARRDGGQGALESQTRKKKKTSRGGWKVAAAGASDAP